MFKMVVILLFLMINFSRLTHAQKYAGCHEIPPHICKTTNYNHSVFPNFFNHASLYEAMNAFQKSSLNMDCSVSAEDFFCYLYFPLCSDYKKPIPLCRSYCQSVKNHCGGFGWPTQINCNDYEDSEFCYGPKNECKTKLSKNFTCPNDMKTTNFYKNSYKFMGQEDCAAPCEEDNLLFWSKDQRRTAVITIGSLSFLCAISTLFTSFTYLIDMKRFHYPERPIVFLSVCYLGVSIAYICGYFLADSVSCQKFHTENGCHRSEPIENCPKVVTQGAREAGCTILFMVVYFFSMAGSIWWIVLSFTWFLAAGKKWGHEAIEEKSSYFHAVGWAVPAIQTIVVLISGKIEGDVLSGVCFVGIYNSTDLRNFLLIPLTIYLATGTVFLIAGFHAMYNIRNQMRSDHGTSKVYKLERLMVKIGVFSVLYTVPAACTVACLFYEFYGRDSWQRGWVANNCKEYSIPCPCEFKADAQNKPSFAVFIIKYSMMLIVGITSGFWIWSAKTVEGWSSLFSKLFRCGRDPPSASQPHVPMSHNNPLLSNRSSSTNNNASHYPMYQTRQY